MNSSVPSSVVAGDCTPVGGQAVTPAGDKETCAGASSLSITTHRGLEGLLSLRIDWEATTSRMAGRRHHFHLWEWHMSQLESLATHPERVVYHVARQDGRTVAILPLEEVRHKSWAPPRIGVLGLPHHKHTVLSDMICDPAAEDQNVIASMIRQLRRPEHGWDVLQVCGVLEKSACLGRLAAKLPWPAIAVPRSKCDTLTHPSAEALLANISKNFRANLRKARNKLAKLPDVRFELVRDPQRLSWALQQFCEVEASGWKGTSGRGTAIALNPDIQSFYRQLTERFGASGRCLIHLLMTGDKCIAGQFCLELDRTIYVLKIGYDEKYASLAPGNMLLERLIQETSTGTEPAGSWNLISGAEWHRDWKPEEEPVRDILIFNRTMRGIGLYLALTVKRGLAHLRGRLLPAR